MDIDDLRSKSPEELRGCLELCRRELVDLHFKKKAGQPMNTARIGDVRRTVARILTVLAGFGKKGGEVNV